MLVGPWESPLWLSHRHILRNARWACCDLPDLTPDTDADGISLPLMSGRIAEPKGASIRPITCPPSADSHSSSGRISQRGGWEIQRHGVNLTIASPGTAGPVSSHSPVGSRGFSSIAQKQKRAVQLDPSGVLVTVRVNPVGPCVHTYLPCHTPSIAMAGAGRSAKAATISHSRMNGGKRR